MTKSNSSGKSGARDRLHRAVAAPRSPGVLARMASAANDRCELCGEKGATGRVKIGPLTVIICDGCAKAGMSVIGIFGRLLKK